jgi:hypothetical protein
MLQIAKYLKFRTSSNKHRKNNAQGYFDKDRSIIITRAILCIAIVALAIASILQIILPVSPYQPELFEDGFVPLRKKHQPADSKTQIKMKHSNRSGLFKPSRRVNTYSITDKTVEKIFNGLKLQGIMPIGDQKVAYIVLKGGYMRKCKIGDTVQDMFTVTDIKSKSVNIDILGHKLTLNR